MKKLKRIGQLLFVLLLLVGVHKVQAMDLPASCSVKFEYNEEEFLDLENSHLVIDVYRVGDVIPDSRYETYSLEATGAFSSLNASLSDLTAMSDDDFIPVAQEAASIVQANPNLAYVQTTLNKELDLDAGLYLALPHGSNIASYFATSKLGSLVTISQSNTYEYRYSPILFSLPTKEAVNGSISTANPGAWVNDVEISLKIEQDVRYGNLEIVKTLNNFDGNGPATFVFDVRAYSDAAMTDLVYSNVESIVFTDAGVDSVVIAGAIPVGSYVVVSEVYSGASYEIVSANGTTVIENPVDTFGVSFENDSNDTDNHGSSVTNRFTFTDMGMNEPNQDFGGQ